jgi:hypothetical protein
MKRIIPQVHETSDRRKAKNGGQNGKNTGQARKRNCYCGMLIFSPVPFFPNPPNPNPRRKKGKI